MIPQVPTDLDSLRHLAEAFRAVLELEKLDRHSDNPAERGDSDLAASYSGLTSRASLELIERKTADAPTESERRRLRKLKAWLTQAFVDHEVRNIDQRIEQTARSITPLTSLGPELPLLDARFLLAHVSEATERAKIEGARVAASEQLAPLLAERLGMYRGIAQSLGHENFVQLWASSLDQDPQSLTRLAHQVLNETRDMYREVLGWTCRKRLGLPLEDAHRRDLPYVFASHAARCELPLAIRELTMSLRAAVERMGLSLSGDQRLSILSAVTPGRPARSFVCAPRVPGDVRLVLRGPGEFQDLDPILDSLGRALFLSHIDPKAAFEDRCLGDGAIDLSYARLFRSLGRNLLWLKRNFASMALKDDVRLANLEQLFELRLSCTRLIYELELYQQGKTTGMRERFSEIFDDALGVRSSPAHFLHEVRRPFLSATRLRAQLFEALYAQHLAHYFNPDWWQNPRVGAFVRQEWSTGRARSLEEMTRELGFEDLSPSPLLRQLSQVL